MGLFSKKTCSVCGGDAGRVFTKKLEDGILCKECTNKLSPFFSERRNSTVAQIEEQLAYREANKEKVAALNVSRTLGLGTKVMIDESAGVFAISSSKNWRDENPDVISIDSITNCLIDLKEDRTEEHYTDDDGNTRSYNPPRYNYDYDFYIVLSVNNPYFDTIRFKVNNWTIHERYSAEFQDSERQANEIKEALTTMKKEQREAAAAANAPKQAVKCPYCGATTMPDAAGCCEYCGGALNS